MAVLETNPDLFGRECITCAVEGGKFCGAADDVLDKNLAQQSRLASARRPIYRKQTSLFKYFKCSVNCKLQRHPFFIRSCIVRLAPIRRKVVQPFLKIAFRGFKFSKSEGRKPASLDLSQSPGKSADGDTIK